jgi:hypothetical protein
MLQPVSQLDAFECIGIRFAVTKPLGAGRTIDRLVDAASR